MNPHKCFYHPYLFLGTPKYEGSIHKLVENACLEADIYGNSGMVRHSFLKCTQPRSIHSHCQESAKQF